jgi:hypothetical protein
VTQGIIISQGRRYGIEESVLVVIYYAVSFSFVSRSAHDVSTGREVKLKTLIKQSSPECKNVFLDTEINHKIWPAHLLELDV